MSLSNGWILHCAQNDNPGDLFRRPLSVFLWRHLRGERVGRAFFCGVRWEFDYARRGSFVFRQDQMHSLLNRATPLRAVMMALALSARGLGAEPVVSTEEAFPRAARCFHQFDDHRRIHAIRLPYFISIKERVEARPWMHVAPTTHHKFATILESNNERLEWLLNLAVEDFLEHEWSVERERNASKGFF